MLLCRKKGKGSTLYIYPDYKQDEVRFRRKYTIIKELDLDVAIHFHHKNTLNSILKQQIRFYNKQKVELDKKQKLIKLLEKLKNNGYK